MSQLISTATDHIIAVMSEMEEAKESNNKSSSFDDLSNGKEIKDVEKNKPDEKSNVKVKEFNKGKICFFKDLLDIKQIETNIKYLADKGHVNEEAVTIWSKIDITQIKKLNVREILAFFPISYNNSEKIFNIQVGLSAIGVLISCLCCLGGDRSKGMGLGLFVIICGYWLRIIHIS